jgi:hypothetical protein
VFNGHELTVGNETMIGFVSETRGVDGYVGTLVGQVDERRVVGVLPIDVNLKIEILFIKNSRSIKILSLFLNLH